MKWTWNIACLSLALGLLLRPAGWADGPDSPCVAPPTPPRPPHRLTLSTEQRAHMQQIRQAFEAQNKVDDQGFETQVESILTASQRTRFQQLQGEREHDQQAFEQGEARARHMLAADGQPLRGDVDATPGGDVAPPPPPPPPRRPLPLEQLKLSPQQQGEVAVFMQARMAAGRQAMEAMRQHTQAILTPEQQAELPPPPPPPFDPPLTGEGGMPVPPPPPGPDGF